jgi:hypothetical protein
MIPYLTDCTIITPLSRQQREMGGIDRHIRIWVKPPWHNGPPRYKKTIAAGRWLWDCNILLKVLSTWPSLCANSFSILFVLIIQKSKFRTQQSERKRTPKTKKRIKQFCQYLAWLRDLNKLIHLGRFGLLWTCEKNQFIICIICSLC